MRKTSISIISVMMIFGILLIGCAPAQVEPTKIAAPPTSTYSPLPIVVSPFYDSQSNQINVGDFSQELSTHDFQELSQVVQEMEKQKDKLTPEQMFVLSIKLFDLGDNDKALYWFYEAQFRAKIFLIALDPSHVGSIGDPSFELPTAYNAFTQLTTEFINGYAGCDIENWVKIATTVKNDNPKPPELDKLFPGVVFVRNTQWQMLNDQVAAGLDALISYITENKESIKQQRKDNNSDARFCS